MYLEKLSSLLVNFYHAYPLYVVAILVVLVILTVFKTKAMAKLGALIIALIVVIYIAGLIQQGISSNADKAQTRKEKAQAQIDK